jgi:GNAT superfamily N-acetyltransferase
MIVRPATESGVPAIARIHVDTWRTTYKGLIAQDYLDSLSYEQKEAQWLSGIRKNDPATCRLVAESDGRVIGIAIAGSKRPDQWPDVTSELYAMYVPDDQQGRGVGSKLYAHVVDFLKSQRHEKMLIQVLKGNDKTISFYESRGAVLVGEGQVELAGRSYDHLIYQHDLTKTGHSL